MAAVLLALVLTGKIGFANNLVTTLTLGENMTRVPSVINYSVGVAQEKLDEQEIVPIIGGRETSDVIPANMVLRQSVSAGEIVEKNSSIELFISALAAPVMEDGKMPDVAYYTESEAADMLRQLGAVVSVEQEYSSDVAEGIVIRGSIGTGEPLAEGTEVGDSESLSVYTTPNGQSVSWSSSNTNVATVSNSGKVSAVGGGSTTIKAAIWVGGNEYSASCSLTVKESVVAPTSYSISASKSSVDTGETVRITPF